MATVTSKGQVTIPKSVRDELGITPGCQVRFDLENGRVVLRREIQRAAIERWRGYLKADNPGLTTDDLMKELRDR